MSNCYQSFLRVGRTFESATFKMLSLLAWCGFLPKKLHEWEVYSKLGGNLLGRVPKARLADAYTMVRSLQDQISLFYKHARRPPRYIAIFVEQTRLTSPDFPFVDQLGLQEAEKVFAALGGARRIDVLWDESDQLARTWLWSQGRQAHQTDTRLVVFSHSGRDVKYYQALPLQLEMFSFQAIPIERIDIAFNAQELNGVDMFPHLEELSCRAENVDFAALSRSKTLVALDLGLPVLAQQVGVMQNLQTLKVHVPTTTSSCVPTELGLLTNLSKLCLMNNFTGDLPSEVGNMQGLLELTLGHTRLSKLPDELRSLSKLKVLKVDYNTNIRGALPEGLCELRFLRHVSLKGNLIHFAATDRWIQQPGCRVWTRDLLI